MSDSDKTLAGASSSSEATEPPRPSSPQQDETSKLVKKTTFAPDVIIQDPPEYSEVSNSKDTVIEVEDGRNRFNVESVSLQPASPSSPSHDTVASNQMTTDFLQPNSVYYRMTDPKPRPPIDSVSYRNQQQQQRGNEGQDGQQGEDANATPLKFGWIIGVLVRCVLNIWGVMLFLRMSFIVGQAGVAHTLLIIALSSIVTLITTSSMSAICTNGQVRGGGAYYLISRSLGPEFGGAIGIIFSAANVVAVAMYTVGFAETVQELYEGSFTGSKLHDVRVIGVITLFVLLGITQLGMAWESKAQLVLLVILLISIANFMIGTVIPPTDYKKSYGFFGYSTTVLGENFWPSPRDEEGFFYYFSLFFPAATGILAGCNISGDLKDAQTAIPKGTFLAIIITTITYMLVALQLGMIQVRDATGMLASFVGVENATGPLGYNCTLAACQFGWLFVKPENNCVLSADAESANKCFQGGLLNDYQAMQKISIVGQIIIAGIFAATLSSALASLVSAPKIFQAVCRDNIFPYIGVLGKGAKKTDEPRRAYIVAFVISLGFILIGELNIIAPIISNFFLASYTLINYSCFSSSLSKSPGWRPAYKYYNMWLSLLGAIVCCAIMFVIKWWAALITIVIVLAIYKYVDYKKPNINWGSSTQAIVYKQALNSTLKLNLVEDHVRNFRPQMLVMTGCPSHRPALVHLASNITKSTSLMVCGSVITNGERKYPFDQVRAEQDYLNSKKYKAFYSCVLAPTMEVGASSLMQTAGLGKMKTNTLLLGFKTDWQRASGAKVMDYTKMIRKGFDMRFGVCVLRMQKGLDISAFLQEESSELDLQSARKLNNSAMMAQEAGGEPKVDFAAADQEQVRIDMKNPDITDSKHALVQAITQLQSKPVKGKTIDVWWCTEDGGLTVLLPHIISQRPQWSGCKMRVFAMRNPEGSDGTDYSMARLISKFRIDCEDINIIDDLKAKPRPSSLAEFRQMLEPHRVRPAEGETVDEALRREPWKVTDEEVEKKKDKTTRHIRFQELLQEHSKDAALIFITLPLPKDLKSSALYMSWLDFITKDLPPIVLIRGNQTSVLTFYS